LREYPIWWEERDMAEYYECARGLPGISRIRKEITNRRWEIVVHNNLADFLFFKVNGCRM
jgi:hypothetical protein